MTPADEVQSQAANVIFARSIDMHALIILRHGRPEWQLPHFISLAQYRQGIVAYDAAHLSEAGMRSIEALAARLPEAVVLSSDLLRARETAEIIRRGTATIKFDAVFRELQAPTIGTRFLGRVRLPLTIWSLIHWGCWLVGIGEYSEGPRAAWRRAGEATTRILSFFREEETIILVSHGWFITLLTLYLRKHGLIERGSFIPKVSHFGGLTEYRLRVA
jgi:broad specificity phosphatase PhoE